MKRTALLSMMIFPALFAASEQAAAQLRKPQLGIYAGGTLPTGDFKEESSVGWHAGGLFKVRVTGALDVRLDGGYNALAAETIEFLDGDVTSASRFAFGALNAELNLGPDSAAYPGDNSISPYLTAGPAYYRFSYEARCTGECLTTEISDTKSKLGLNIGAGANIPLRGIPAFAEFRYHRFGTTLPISQTDATATLITASFGVKIR